MASHQTVSRRVLSGYRTRCAVKACLFLLGALLSVAVVTAQEPSPTPEPEPTPYVWNDAEKATVAGIWFCVGFAFGALCLTRIRL